MDIKTVDARPRSERGSRACRRLRRLGLVPAVLYGHGQPNVLLTLPLSTVERLLREHTLVVTVRWDGHEETAQLADVQYDALGDQVTHVDLQRVSLTETITVTVPVEPHGEPVGVEKGGMLELQLHELEVECLPTNVPESIRIEVGGLDIGDALHVGDIEFPDGVKPVAEPQVVVAVVTPPAAAPEEEVEAEQAGAEPEVIGREEAEPEGEQPEQQ